MDAARNTTAQTPTTSARAGSGSALKLRVVKVGGSLFDWPQLPRQLCHWLAQQPAAINHMVAGGGVLADAVRQLDRTLQLGDDAAHDLAIDAMRMQSRALQRCLGAHPCPGQSLVWDELFRRLAACDEQSPAPFAVPHCWDVTSDSLAAWLAAVLDADELVLLKSTEVSTALTLRDAARQGIVDAYFPIAARHVRRIRLVNLRVTATNESPQLLSKDA